MIFKVTLVFVPAGSLLVKVFSVATSARVKKEEEGGGSQLSPQGQQKVAREGSGQASLLEIQEPYQGTIGRGLSQSLDLERPPN